MCLSLSLSHTYTHLSPQKAIQTSSVSIYYNVYTHYTRERNESSHGISCTVLPGDQGRRDGHLLPEDIPEARVRGRRRDTVRRGRRVPQARAAPRGPQAHGQGAGLKVTRGIKRTALPGMWIVFYFRAWFLFFGVFFFGD